MDLIFNAKRVIFVLAYNVTIGCQRVGSKFSHLGGGGGTHFCGIVIPASSKKAPFTMAFYPTHLLNAVLINCNI